MLRALTDEPLRGELRARRPGEREDRERPLTLAHHRVSVRIAGNVARIESLIRRGSRVTVLTPYLSYGPSVGVTPGGSDCWTRPSCSSTRAATPLPEGEEAARGVWVRQLTLENPAK